MKIFILSFVLLAVSSNAFSQNLKSDKLRKLACASISDYLVDNNIEFEYETSWGDPVQVLPDFDKNCAKSMKSFTVSNTVYNQIAEKITSISIDINLVVKKKLKVEGSITLRRTAFDPHTGEIKLGKWKSVSTDISYKFESDMIKTLAKVISQTANIHNGDAGLDTFNPSTFSLEKQVKLMNQRIAERNSETSCKMEKIEKNAKWMFEESEGYASTAAPEVLELLENEDAVLYILGSESIDWRESCANYDVYIYLKDGSIVVINYDFTT